MSQKELDNIVYFSYIDFEDKLLYKINIFNLSKELFTRMFCGNLETPNIKFLSSDLFCKEIYIYDLISVRDFVWFNFQNWADLDQKNVPIKPHYLNFSYYTEDDMIELIKLFDVCSIFEEKHRTKDLYDDYIDLLKNLKQNYKKYLNEATIKDIIE